MRTRDAMTFAWLPFCLRAGHRPLRRRRAARRRQHGCAEPVNYFAEQVRGGRPTHVCFWLVYGEGVQPGDVNMVVENTGDYLAEHVRGWRKGNLGSHGTTLRSRCGDCAKEYLENLGDYLAEQVRGWRRAHVCVSGSTG